MAYLALASNFITGQVYCKKDWEMWSGFVPGRKRAWLGNQSAKSTTVTEVYDDYKSLPKKV